ncbi:hypothetical protein G6F62_005997 [Rhizopus arrhizus]|nr:hypothetical protein G6F62_005997 [Rhizopus arrhizus]
MESVRIDFPLKPYPAQLQMMSKIIHALNHSENALLESPTGSGKSLALLCAALAWRENERKKMAEQRAKALAEMEEQRLRDIESIAKQLSEDSTSVEKKREREDIDPSEWKKRFKCDENNPFDDDDDFQPNQILNSFKTAEVTNPVSPSNNDTPLETNKSLSSAPLSSIPKIPRIYVGSRTHKQLTQLISELKRNTQYTPRMTVLGSRDQLCIHPKVSKSANKNEDCVNLLDKQACGYAHRTKKVLAHPALQSTLRVWDIEDMISLGKEVRGCPYYTSRNLFESAEVIFCPYNYILDPVIRKVMNIDLEGSIIILDEAHNMEDAARSAGSFELDDRALSMVKIELTQIIKSGFEVSAHQILEYLFDGLWEWVCSADNVYDIKEYERHICVWSGQKIIEKLKELNITAHVFESQFVPAYRIASTHAETVRKESENRGLVDDNNEKEEKDNDAEVVVHRRKCLSNSSLNIVQGIFLIFGYLFREDSDYTEDYRMALMKRVDRGGKIYGARKNNRKSAHDSTWAYKLGFWCLNPGIIFQDMCAKTKSVILTSGTLSPMDTFASELDTKFSGKLEANHVIDPSQVWVSCLPVGPNGTYLKGVYSNMESFQYQDDIGEAICQIAETVPFGILCFLPSYNALDKLMERWALTGTKERMESKKLILSEPKGSDKKVFEKAINRFYDHIDNAKNYLTEEKDGAIFFAVYRGKVSEGIDFTNEYCRAVVAIGIPYPGVKDMEVQLKKEYNDMKRKKHKNNDVLSGREWYSIQAYRAINQALGRCIRHKNDWGAIILLEDRFQTQETIKGLSKWIRGKVQIHHKFSEGMSSLKKFVQHRLSVEQEPNTAIKTEVTVTNEPATTTKIYDSSIISSSCKTLSGADTTEMISHTQSSASTHTKETVPFNDNHVKVVPFDSNLVKTKESIETADISIPVDEKTEEMRATLMEDLDALMKDIDDDTNCEQSQHDPFIDFFNKNVKTEDSNSRKPVICKYCNCTLMTGDMDNLKPVDNVHLNCVLYLNQNDTQMLEVENPASWDAPTLCINISDFPTETQVYMNKIDNMRCNIT